ncbi:DedA family protein [Streptomyces sp. RB6PN25]|uniref:DedA family protein n=2 Tax=Streptomyces humicola TaxID=2953240 RepID=A0ABT1PVM3_9ACTN|nr:DedA family protein [Streptomyces humicola]MCQ4081718.1 DedA family protein [Streptomyces humicola]
MHAVNPMNSAAVLSAFGALGVLVVIFAESGLIVVGFFLPGDTLLFPAGLLCSGGHGPHLQLGQVLVCAAVGAVTGAQAGYEIGRRGGRALLARSSNRQLKRGITRAEEVLARYGYGKAIVLGRFVPMLRTVLNPVAGALEVPARTFLLWQAIGGVAWSQGLVLAGYALGASVPHVDHYLLPLVGLIVSVSLLPLVGEVAHGRRARAAARNTAAAADAREERTGGRQ